MLGKPQLGNDFTTGQVAAKALVSRGAKAAAHRAPGLRRNAQRAAIVLGDEHRLDRIAIAHIKQPLDRAVARFLLGEDFQAFNAGLGGELFAQRLGQIGHLGKVGRPALVNPAKQLRGAKRFFPQLLAIRNQAWEIKIQKIGQGSRGSSGHDAHASASARTKRQRPMQRQGRMGLFAVSAKN